MAASSLPSGHSYSNTEVSGSSSLHQGDVLNFYQPVFIHSIFSQTQICHQLFKTSDYESHRSSIPEATPGTCRWVLEHPRFLQWQEKDCEKVLWLSAYPGCGKFVLVRLLVDNHLPLRSDLTVCHFVFRRGYQEQENLNTALCAILHQLFSSQPRLLHHAILEWRKSGHKIYQESSILWRILQSAMADPIARQVACVIDAVDECSAEERRLLIKLVGRCCSGQNGKNVPLKFLLTSRPCHDMERLVEEAVQPQSLIRLQGENETGRLRKEIELVIRQKVKNLAQTYELTVNHKRRLLSQLLKMEQRTYLWWSLAFSKICEAYEGSLNPDQVRIRDLSISIEEEYERVLDNIEPKFRAHAKTILSIMIAARRPLTVLEVALALEIALAIEGKSVITHVDTKQLMRQIRRWCGFLVLAHRKRLYLVHDTVRTFLLHCQFCATECKLGVWRHSISPAVAHRTLAIVCHIVLQRHRALPRSYATSREPETILCTHHGRNTLLSYARAFAIHHAAEAIQQMDTYRGVFFVHRLFSFGMNLQTMDERGKSLLHRMTDFSAPKVDISVISSILNCGGLVQTADWDEGNCLQYAVLKNQAALADLLIRSGFAIDGAVAGQPRERSADGITAVDKLPKRRHSIADSGPTALHTAITFCDFWGVKYLVQKGADVYKTDTEGHTALHVAALPYWKQITFGYDLYRWKNKVEFRADPDFSTPESKIRKQIKARSAIVSYLCDISPNLVDVPDSDGLTALDLAAEACQFGSETVSALLRMGANPKVPGGDGVTAAHRIARRGPVRLLELLFSPFTIEFSFADKLGRTVLHFAAMGRNEAAVRYILDQTESTNLRFIDDRRGQNALQASLFEEEFYTSKPLLSVLQVLTESGIQANHRNYSGQDALAHYIIRNKAVTEAEVVEFLLIRGCDPLHEDDGRLNLAHHLVYSQIEHSIAPLLVLQKWGTNLYATDSKGRTVLHHAAIAGTIRPDLLKHLKYCLHLGFEIRDVYDKTALDYVGEIMRDKLSSSYMNSKSKSSTSAKVSSKIARTWVQSYACLQKLADLGTECCCDIILGESHEDISTGFEAVFGSEF